MGLKRATNVSDERDIYINKNAAPEGAINPASLYHQNKACVRKEVGFSVAIPQPVKLPNRY